VDIQLPDGTMVQGVPDGTSKAELAQKLKANGRDVPADWLAPSPAAPAAKSGPPQFTGKPSDWLQAGQGVMRLMDEPRKILASALGGGAATGPISDVVGLADIPAHMAGLTQTTPEEMKQKVGQGISQAAAPMSSIGRAIDKYNPMNLIGRGVEALAKKGENLVAPPKTSGPLRSALGYGVKGAIEQAPNVIGALGGKRAGESFPERQAALSKLKSENAITDATRKAVHDAGLVTPPEGKSWIAGIPGVGRIDKWIAKADEARVDKLVAKDFGKEKILPGDLKSIREAQWPAYENIVKSATKEPITEQPPPKTVKSAILDERGQPITRQIEQPPVTRVPGMKAHREFRSQLAKNMVETRRALKKYPETNKAMAPALRLMREYSKKEIDPADALNSIKKLRREAGINFKSRDDPMKLNTAFTQKFIADSLEDMFERNLQETGQTQALQAFRKARTMIAKTYDAEYAYNKSTGHFDANKLRILEDRGRPLSQNLALVAKFARAYPKAAQKVGELPRVTLWDLGVSGAFALAGHPYFGLGEIAGRVGIPAAAERGLFQTRTPSYQAGYGAQSLYPLLGAALSGNQIAPPPQ
jgi:hypothetical protein